MQMHWRAEGEKGKEKMTLLLQRNNHCLIFWLILFSPVSVQEVYRVGYIIYKPFCPGLFQLHYRVIKQCYLTYLRDIMFNSSKIFHVFRCILFCLFILNFLNCFRFHTMYGCWPPWECPLATPTPISYHSTAFFIAVCRSMFSPLVFLFWNNVLFLGEELHSWDLLLSFPALSSCPAVNQSSFGIFPSSWLSPPFCFLFHVAASLPVVQAFGLGNLAPTFCHWRSSSKGAAICKRLVWLFTLVLVCGSAVRLLSYFCGLPLPYGKGVCLALEVIFELRFWLSDPVMLWV